MYGRRGPQPTTQTALVSSRGRYVLSRICFVQLGWHLAKLPPKQQSSRLDVAIDIGCCRAQNTLSGSQWVHNCLCDVHAL